jgi:hypothetical protein
MAAAACLFFFVPLSLPATAPSQSLSSITLVVYLDLPLSTQSNMAASSSTSQSAALLLAPPVALVVSDQELPHDGSSVVSTCVLRKYFGYFGITRVRLPLVNQFPSGLLLPVTVPNLAHLIDHFSTFTREQYTEIACAHSIAFKSVDRKDYIRDLLRVHQCDVACAPNLLVFKHLKVPRRDFSRLILPDPFTVDFRAERNATQRIQRSAMDGSQSRRSHIRDAECHAANYRVRVPDPLIIDDPDFPKVRTFEEKMGIIEQWQHEMSAQHQERGACAVCAHNVCIRFLCICYATIVCQSTHCHPVMISICTVALFCIRRA